MIVKNGFGLNERHENAILYAGQKTFGTCENNRCVQATVQKENGEYLDEDPFITFPLIKNRIYAIESEDMTGAQYLVITRLKNEPLIEVMNHSIYPDESMIRGSQAKYGVKTVHLGGEKEISAFERLEYLLSFPVRNLANGLVIIMNKTLGHIDGAPDMTVSIDTIVFDQYPLTKLSIFEKNLKNGEVVNPFIADFIEIINIWYRNFMLIAMVAYLLILLYMGIRIVLNSTAAKQTMFKEVFMQWVLGVLILFTFPIVIRYAIKINSALVEMVRTAVEQDTAKAGKGTSLDPSEVTTDYKAPDETSQIKTATTFNEEAKTMEKNPFDKNDKGYMAVIARRAHDTKRLAYAFVYIIMTFQLLIIAVTYYKRLFIVAFLIVIFPIVMIAHLLEKVADIKVGGAFSKWSKEIFLAIFVQSIHAIIYSFTITTVVVAGDNNNDWILMLVGVTFLFSGEEILKKILGQASETTKSFASTAAKAVVAAKAIGAVRRKVADNFIGTDSHLGRWNQARKERKTYEIMGQGRKKYFGLAGPRGPALVDTIGQTAPTYKMPSPNNLENYETEYNAASSIAEKADVEELGKAIQTLNHMQFARPEDIAKAMNVVAREKQSGKHDTLLKDLKMSNAQFATLQNSADKVASDAASGKKTKQQIDMQLTMELSQTFPDTDPEVLKVAVYSQMKSCRLPGFTSSRRNEDPRKIDREVDTARRKYDAINGSIRFAKDSRGGRTRNNDNLEKDAVKLLEDVYGQKQRYSRAQYKMALSATMIKHSGSGEYDAKELMTSANYLFRNQNESKEFEKMAKSIGCDIEDYRHILAHRVKDKAQAEDRVRVNKINSGTSTLADEAFTETDEAALLADEVIAEYREAEITKRARMAGELERDTDGSIGATGTIDEIRTTIKKNKTTDILSGANLVDEDSRRVTVSDIVFIESVDKNQAASPGLSGSGQSAETRFKARLATERAAQNAMEASIIDSFADEMLAQNHARYDEATTRVVYEPPKKINGMTKEELMAAQAAALEKSRRERTKAILTTSASVVGAPLGAAMGIGLGDDEGLVQEAVTGGLAGAFIGDSLAEGITKEERTVKTEVWDPYTGRVEEIEVKVSVARGMSDEAIREQISGVLQQDPSVRKQLLEKKLKHDAHYEQSRQNAIEKESSQRRLDEAYRRAMNNANRNNGSNT